jgi:hypothetical protein
MVHCPETYSYNDEDEDDDDDDDDNEDEDEDADEDDEEDEDDEDDVIITSVLQHSLKIRSYAPDFPIIMPLTITTTMMMMHHPLPITVPLVTAAEA